jgi:hypothetical protein
MTNPGQAKRRMSNMGRNLDGRDKMRKTSRFDQASRPRRGNRLKGSGAAYG